jgi:hypothetical protein
VPLPQLAGVAGPAPHVLVSPDPELSEQPAMPSEPQTVPAPGGVTGLLSAPGETDTYRFTTQPGQAYRVEVWGQRLGSPIDPVLTVNAEKGGGLGSADDSPESADPRLDVTVPTGATGLRVTVRDAAGRGGPDFLYRVTVTPKARPDVSLTLENDTFLIPAGGSTSLRVKLQRKGYNGPLDLAWQGLPNGVAGTPSTIPAGVNEAIVSLTTTPEAEPAAQLVRLQATAGGVRQTVVGPGTGPVSLRQDLGCAVVPARPISVAWSGPELTTYTPGSKLTAGANVTRGPTAMGAVRLSLVTSQNVPLAPNKKPDLAKALRLDGEAQIAAGQTSTPLTLAVPADLPKLPYDLVLRAELLSADGKTVQATAETPVRSIQPPAAEKPKAPAKKK